MISSLRKIQLKILSYTFPIHFYTFFIRKAFNFNFSRNPLNEFENALNCKDEAFLTLQLCCTSQLNSMVASF